jgi:hypothetical protein
VPGRKPWFFKGVALRAGLCGVRLRDGTFPEPDSRSVYSTKLRRKIEESNRRKSILVFNFVLLLRAFVGFDSFD